MMTLNIQGFDKADVLVALYNAAKPANTHDTAKLTKEAAQELINTQADLKFDTINGRTISADISSDHLDFDAFIKANALVNVNAVLQELQGKRLLSASLPRQTRSDTFAQRKSWAATDMEVGGNTHISRA